MGSISQMTQIARIAEDIATVCRGSDSIRDHIKRLRLVIKAAQDIIETAEGELDRLPPEPARRR
jgi:DNA-binding ferritin-like protein